MGTHAIENTETNPATDRDQAVAASLSILQHLRDSRPRWTRNLPTREGYYWTRGNKRDHTMVVLVRIDYSETETPFVVQAGHPEDTGVQYLRDYNGCQWCGPLEFPHDN